MTPTCFATFGPVVDFHHPQPTSLKVTRQCRSHPASNELDERAASVMIVGSHTIGNFTELAMKHARWASACKVVARSRSAPADSAIRGRSTTPVMRPLPSAFSTRSERIIPVADNVHAGSGAQVQIPQHVAGGDRSHEQLFRVVAVHIAAERRVGRCLDRRFGPRFDEMVAAIVPVTRCPGTAVSRPANADLVDMRPAHWH